MALSLRASAALGMTSWPRHLVSFIQQIVREQVQQTMGDCWVPLAARRRRLRMAQTAAQAAGPERPPGSKLESAWSVVHQS